MNNKLIKSAYLQFVKKLFTKIIFFTCLVSITTFFSCSTYTIKEKTAKRKFGLSSGIYNCHNYFSFHIFSGDLLIFDIENSLALAWDLVTLRLVWDHEDRPLNGLINTLLHTLSLLPFYEHSDETSPLYGINFEYSALLRSWNNSSCKPENATKNPD
jgi:hypothetical protein